MRRLLIIPALLVAAFAVGYCDGRSRVPAPDTREVDSVRAVNDSLRTANTGLELTAELALHGRDSLRAKIDTLRAQSDTMTAELKRRRVALPGGSLDSAILHTAYNDALVLLDDAFKELAQKDAIIKLDEAALQKSIDRELALLAQIENYKVQVRNEQIQSAFWLAEYKKASKPRCGRKCGIVIGALGVIGTAIGIDKVRDAFKDQPVVVRP